MFWSFSYLMCRCLLRLVLLRRRSEASKDLEIVVLPNETSRRIAQAILDRLDADGVTRRVGDERILRRRRIAG